MQTASLELVQLVWPLAQLATAGQLVQVGQVSNGPLTRWRPAAQLAHCESLVPPQLRPAAQPTTGAQLEQLAVPLPK